MRRASLLALALALVALTSCRSTASPERAGPWLVHNVFLKLKNDSPEARRYLIESMYRELAPIDGVQVLAAGEREGSLTRDSNDRDFDVALTIVFRDRAALDHYLPDARHQKLLTANRDNLESIRVFDSSAPSLLIPR